MFLGQLSRFSRCFGSFGTRNGKMTESLGSGKSLEMNNLGLTLFLSYSNLLKTPPKSPNFRMSLWHYKIMGFFNQRGMVGLTKQPWTIFTLSWPPFTTLRFLLRKTDLFLVSTTSSRLPRSAVHNLTHADKKTGVSSVFRWFLVPDLITT